MHHATNLAVWHAIADWLKILERADAPLPEPFSAVFDISIYFPLPLRGPWSFSVISTSIILLVAIMPEWFMLREVIELLHKR